MLPVFQVDFGQDPCVKARDFGLLGLKNDLLVFTNCSIQDGKLEHKILLLSPQLLSSNMNHWLNRSISNLHLVTEVDISRNRLLPEHLEMLAIACPTIRQLNLMHNTQYLTSLQGLCAISVSCCNLEGLNVSGIPVRKLGESHTILGNFN